MTVEKFKNKLDTSDFAIMRKKSTPSYSNLTGAMRSVSESNIKRFRMGGINEGSVTNLASFVSGDQLDRFFENPASSKKIASLLSDALYATTPIYSEIINYFKDMYYWRYVTTPRKVKNTSGSPEKYKEIYNEMLEVVDGINIENTFPKILLNLFKNGEVFLYTTKDQSSKTIQTILLPKAFCRSTVFTQYGTSQIEFNFNFFDSLGLKAEELVEFLELFPKEMKEMYENYSKNRGSVNKWHELNPKYSTCFKMNELGFPTYLNVFYDLIDYKTYKINELDRNSNLLERILVQEIDLSKDDNLDLAEVEQLHNNLTAALTQSRGTMLVTSIGKIHTEYLQTEESAKNQTLQNAFNSIYSNAGLNYYLFSGDSAESIDASLKRDLRTVWSFVEDITRFYNLSINNLFNFHDYQASLRVLPISLYSDETISKFRENSEYGVGKLDFIVASGVKQIDIEATLELENYLDLSNKLVPLHSSHTLSSTSETETVKTNTNTKTGGVQTDEE